MLSRFHIALSLCGLTLWACETSSESSDVDVSIEPGSSGAGGGAGQTSAGAGGDPRGGSAGQKSGGAGQGGGKSGAGQGGKNTEVGGAAGSSGNTDNGGEGGTPGDGGEAQGGTAGGGGGTIAGMGGSTTAGQGGGPGGQAQGGSGQGGTNSGGKGGGTAEEPCTTRITYGNSWIHGSNHPAQFDDVSGAVTWDGSCVVDGTGNASATLSNGWKPYFEGKNGCIIALDSSASCKPAPSSCATRITYGSSWLHSPNHPAQFDDVSGAVTWDGVCHQDGSKSFAVLSNGWKPYFNGTNGCQIALRHTQCDGLFANPVLNQDCPDPGVLRADGMYYMVCTSGGPGYPIRTSPDLVHWTFKGTVFDGKTKPSWAKGDFWAPEIHKVGSSFVVYFSARHNDGHFAVGAAHSKNALGPYQDLGHPLVKDPNPGVIDAHMFESSDGKRYLIWKVDGNAIGTATPIKIQPLAADGLSLTGSPKTILSNTLGWEGALVEGPWMIEHSGQFYLFYSANGYASPSYGIGVARASSPLGPFTKSGAPILSSKGAWAGPGHGSVVKGPSGDWVHVYHAWEAGHVGKAPGRLVLVDRIQWTDGWPWMRSAPSSRSQPLR